MENGYIQLKYSETIKYQGISLDSNLKWNTHTVILTNKPRYLVGKFKYLKNILENEQHKIIYHALVQTLTYYMVESTGRGLTNCWLKNLETVQKLDFPDNTEQI